MINYLFSGRLMMFLGSVILAFALCVAMRYAKMYALMWIQASLAFLFAIHAIVVVAAIGMQSPVASKLEYLVALDGAVHVSVALLFIFALREIHVWDKRRRKIL